MPDFARIREQMEVVGSDGRHVGTVDCVIEEHVILAKDDPDSGGIIHEIPLGWVGMIGQEKLRLNQPAQFAQSNWAEHQETGNESTSSAAYPQ
jgi:hypothetical protein